MLDNAEVATIMKLNELAERYGIKPYEFNATIRHIENGCQLRFEAPPSDQKKAEKFEMMLDVLDVDGNVQLTAPDIGVIYEKLELALDLAPRAITRRGRFSDN